MKTRIVVVGTCTPAHTHAHVDTPMHAPYCHDAKKKNRSTRGDATHIHSH
jgi:hypothetical protein